MIISKLRKINPKKNININNKSAIKRNKLYKNSGNNKDVKELNKVIKFDKLIFLCLIQILKVTSYIKMARFYIM